MKWDRAGSMAVLREDRAYCIFQARIAENVTVLSLVDEKTKTVIAMERDIPSDNGPALKAAVARLKAKADA